MREEPPPGTPEYEAEAARVQNTTWRVEFSLKGHLEIPFTDFPTPSEIPDDSDESFVMATQFIKDLVARTPLEQLSATFNSEEVS